MKVLFYINSLANGGAERSMSNLALQFVQLSYEVVFVTSFRSEWEYQLDVSIRRLSLEEEELSQSRLLRNYSRIKKLRKICKNEHPDVCISFMAEPNFRLIVAALGLDCKTIVSVRNDPQMEYAGTLFSLVGKYLLPRADGCVFQTQEAMQWFPAKLQKKSRVIYNPVKESFYHVKRAKRERLIVSCGRLERQKNFSLLIDAFDIVLQRYCDAKLYIYGEGSLKSELNTYINKHSLQDCVYLMGQTDQVESVMQTADIFVLSSDYEGMPNALMEAMAAGVPAISTDCPCGGPRELFGEDLRENLVPVGDKIGMANRMMELLADERLYNSIALKQKERSDMFSGRQIALQWDQYIRMVIKGEV